VHHSGLEPIAAFWTSIPAATLAATIFNAAIAVKPAFERAVERAIAAANDGAVALDLEHAFGDAVVVTIEPAIERAVERAIAAAIDGAVAAAVAAAIAGAIALPTATFASSSITAAFLATAVAAAPMRRFMLPWSLHRPAKYLLPDVS
jgi:hypothetical protein